jgi:BirA family biotin operon repressor/biotin-[acetyl-CoA-carboxylase] ligase
MTPSTPAGVLLAQLSDGRFHSGERLARILGISRSAVWKRLQRLENELGLEVHAVRGRGYRLASPIELLDQKQILGRLSPAALNRLESLDLHAVIDSTNSAATAAAAPSPGRARVWLAEHQTAGRGRRGRQWVSVFGTNISLSLAWRFERSLSELSGLSLAAGVVVVEALHRCGVQGLGLKWPNDVLASGRKLSGILVEASGEAAGPSTAVIGVGVNARIPASAAESIDQPWTDLARSGAACLSRNAIAADLVDGLIAACDAFESGPMTDMLDRWSAFDTLVDRDVRIQQGDRWTDGVYRGIAASGAARIETATGLEEHFAGEVSLRSQTP